MNNDWFKVNVPDEIQYRKLIITLRNYEIEYYTYEDKQNRPIKVMARGIHPTCSIKLITEDLLDNATTMKPLPLHMLSFNKSADIKDIFAINLIAGLKILLYKQILKPVWVYGVQLWGCTKKSNIKIIQTFHWYIRNDDIHKDLQVLTVSAEIKKLARKHEARLHEHENVEVLQLLENNQLTRRLKRLKPFELV
ncbi:hypothetical protein RN001_016097 [Aquatica leii]|uniref:Uncharacterized protein n=1 Tax=Aquatica leii TaxID=1421715 RepID=A0AAN7NZW5_9COLE|nr:hypothetical protein RN001_016097 [Aquatica leii]